MIEKKFFAVAIFEDFISDRNEKFVLCFGLHSLLCIPREDKTKLIFFKKSKFIFLYIDI